jgi:ATP-dependent Clp protease protease subunit
MRKYSSKMRSNLNSFYISKNSFFGSEPTPNHEISSKLLEERIIFLTGELDDYLCNSIKSQLLYLEQVSPREDIKIYIDSPGGSVYSGLGLLDTMEYISCDIQTINTGLAASMAAIILCSGTPGKRKSLKRSRCMIHQPLGYTGYAQASDIEIDAREINSLKRELYEIIAEKTGQKFDKVHKDGDRDYWMSSLEAKNYGMIDEILTKRI